MRRKVLAKLAYGRRMKVKPLVPPKEGDFFTVKYEIPEQMTKGKKRVAVSFDVPRRRRMVEVGETTVDRKHARRMMPRLFGLKMLEKK